MEIEIKTLDIDTPNIYSIEFKKDNIKYYILLEITTDNLYFFMRQVIILYENIIFDASFDKNITTEIKKDLIGFASPRRIITWSDLKKKSRKKNKMKKNKKSKKKR